MANASKAAPITDAAVMKAPEVPAGLRRVQPHLPPGNQALLRLQRKCSCAGSGPCEACGPMEPSGAQRPRIQTKVPIGPRDDRFEREADATAERIMRMHSASSPLSDPSPLERHQVQRAGQLLEEETEEDEIQRKTAAPATPDPALQKLAPVLSPGRLTEGGTPLSTGLRDYFEPRFGRKFSAVRIHTGEESEHTNRALGSFAFTYGSHIWLGGGQDLSPSALIAHELAHVVQQTGSPGRATDAPERPTVSPAGPVIQRDSKDQPTGPEASACPTNVQPGAARAAPDDHSRGPSGTYFIQGPPYNNESAADYSALGVNAWITWRFGALSAAIAQRIRTEATGWNWVWQSKPPAKGCQGFVTMSIDQMNHLVALAGRDQPAQAGDKQAAKAGLPSLPAPRPSRTTS